MSSGWGVGVDLGGGHLSKPCLKPDGLNPSTMPPEEAGCAAAAEHSGPATLAIPNKRIASG